MAKQTFSVGQVLTAAQMTSLQETAMGGGAPSVKTTSYVLVAADAGKVIQVNSTSSTTITVNTGLFSAGDSVQIQNIGSGTTTITAGTATVNSAGSLAVSQYDGGFLYFNSASSAIWFDYTQPGTTSPLTTKGDIYTRTSSGDARLAVGANGTTLVADSAEATGLKWAAASGGGKVLQVVNATYSTATTIASTTKTDSGLSASITPTASTSKILVLVSQHVWVGRDTERVNGGGFYLLRGSTEIWNGSDQLSWHNFGTGFMQYGTFWTLHFYDNPATTSSITYKTQGDSWTAANGGVLTFQQNSVTSSITLLEIGA